MEWVAGAGGAVVHRGLRARDRGELPVRLRPDRGPGRSGRGPVRGVQGLVP